VAQFLLTFLRQPNPYAVLLGTVLDPIQWISLGMMVTAGIISLQSRKLASHAV
jgi:phosphatidylglycerol:prolipoprotein diacylglycerol transferase